MLPIKKISLTKRAEEKLKREKQTTGQSVNQLATIKFFISLENKRHFSGREKESPAMGSIKLDKTTWLGECLPVVELTLKELYPKTTPEEAAILWALHVESETS